MSHFAIVSPPFLGHLNPLASLARALVGRGHAVTFVGIPEMEPLCAARGHPFAAIGCGSHRTGTLPRLLRHLAAVRGPFGMAPVIRAMAAQTEAVCRDGPDLLRRIGADAVICDETEPGGGLVAARLGLPHVAIAAALPMRREPDVPPPFTGWAYVPSRRGRIRSRGGYRVADRMMRPFSRTVAAWADGWRIPLGPDARAPVLAEISQLVPGLDFPRIALPRYFHYCGPLRGGEPHPAGFAPPPGTGRPRGYASLGTLQGGDAALFGRIAAGAYRAGIDLVLAHGGGLDEAEAAALPGRPYTRPFVPQADALAGADVAILNCGLNTVLDALAASVPIVAVPLAFEQGAIASRLVRSGAGLRISARPGIGARRVAGAVRTMVTDPSYRAAARRLAAEIAAAGGAEGAAGIIETALRTGRPVPAAAPGRAAPSLVLLPGGRAA